ncbi:MAG: hypothetical protein AAF571_07030 [Verrucomicrobiota bacterium]
MTTEKIKGKIEAHAALEPNDTSATWPSLIQWLIKRFGPWVIVALVCLTGTYFAVTIALERIDKAYAERDIAQAQLVDSLKEDKGKMMKVLQEDAVAKQEIAQALQELRQAVWSSRGG